MEKHAKKVISVVVIIVAIFAVCLLAKLYTQAKRINTPMRFDMLLKAHRSAQKKYVIRERLPETIASDLLDSIRPLLDYAARLREKFAATRNLPSTPVVGVNIPFEAFQKDVNGFFAEVVQFRLGGENLMKAIFHGYKKALTDYKLCDPCELEIRNSLPPVPGKERYVTELYEWLERREDTVFEHPHFIPKKIKDKLDRAQGNDDILELLLKANDDTRKKLLTKEVEKYIKPDRSFHDDLFRDIDQMLVKIYAWEYKSGKTSQKGDIYLALDFAEHQSPPDASSGGINSAQLNVTIGSLDMYLRALSSLSAARMVRWAGIVLCSFVSFIAGKFWEPIWKFLCSHFGRS